MGLCALHVDADFLHPGSRHRVIGQRATRQEIDEKTARARREGVLRSEPEQLGEPVGYYVFFADPDGNTLELSYGQRVGLEVLRGEG